MESRSLAAPPFDTGNSPPVSKQPVLSKQAVLSKQPDLRRGIQSDGIVPQPSRGDVGAPLSSRASAVHAIYEPIASPLVAVERRLQGELQSRYESISPLLRHGIQLGGKRLRPALLLLSAIAVGKKGINSKHEILGAVLEMVHTATLIHDDVLDEASTRRHVATINAGWGDHASILLGDYLFSQAFRLSASTGSTLACEWIGEASRRVCEGELRQVLARNYADLDEASYIEMIRGKTAELFSVACRLGAQFAGASDSQAEALAIYGDSLGIAFQIADDYLDVWGDESTVGKTLGTDLCQGKWTLPVLRLLETAGPRGSLRLKAILQGDPSTRYEQLAPLLDSSDSKEYTRQVAIDYRNRALASIESLDESAAKHSLLDLASFAIDRTF